jgi:hypothetical protein
MLLWKVIMKLQHRVMARIFLHKSDLFIMINATFNNISVISWWSVLLVEETGENHRSVASHWQTLWHFEIKHAARLIMLSERMTFNLFSVLFKVSCEKKCVRNNSYWDMIVDNKQFTNGLLNICNVDRAKAWFLKCEISYLAI